MNQTWEEFLGQHKLNRLEAATETAGWRVAMSWRLTKRLFLIQAAGGPVKPAGKKLRTKAGLFPCGASLRATGSPTAQHRGGFKKD